MPKTGYFLEKKKRNCKNRRSVGGSTPLASGGWGSASDPRLFLARGGDSKGINGSREALAAFANEWSK